MGHGSSKASGFHRIKWSIPSWKIRGVADVNNDGKPDLIWQNTANGGLSVWFMNGIVMVSGTSFAPGMVADLNWKVVGPR